MTYTLTPRGVMRAQDSAFIPADPDNMDWRAYQTWLAAGNQPAPAPVFAPVYTCLLWQLQAVMTSTQWTQVQAAIASLNNPALSAFFAHGTNAIPSSSTTLLAIGQGIGLTDAQVVALVQQASSIAIP